MGAADRLLWLAAMSWATTANALCTVDVGGRKQLFVDDAIVDSVHNLRKTMHRPQRHPGPVLTGDEPGDAATFLAQHPVGYSTVVDDQREAGRAFSVEGLPTIVVLDKKGAVVAIRRQMVSERELTALTEAALAQ